MMGEKAFQAVNLWSAEFIISCRRGVIIICPNSGWLLLAANPTGTLCQFHWKASPKNLIGLSTPGDHGVGGAKVTQRAQRADHVRYRPWASGGQPFEYRRVEPDADAIDKASYLLVAGRAVAYITDTSCYRTTRRDERGQGGCSGG